MPMILANPCCCEEECIYPHEAPVGSPAYNDWHAGYRRYPNSIQFAFKHTLPDGSGPNPACKATFNFACGTPGNLQRTLSVQGTGRSTVTPEAAGYTLEHYCAPTSSGCATGPAYSPTPYRYNATFGFNAFIVELVSESGTGDTCAFPNESLYGFAPFFEFYNGNPGSPISTTTAVVAAGLRMTTGTYFIHHILNMDVAAIYIPYVWLLTPCNPALSTRIIATTNDIDGQVGRVLGETECYTASVEPWVEGLPISIWEPSPTDCSDSFCQSTLEFLDCITLVPTYRNGNLDPGVYLVNFGGGPRCYTVSTVAFNPGAAPLTETTTLRPSCVECEYKYLLTPCAGTGPVTAHVNSLDLIVGGTVINTTVMDDNLNNTSGCWTVTVTTDPAPTALGAYTVVPDCLDPTCPTVSKLCVSVSGAPFPDYYYDPVTMPGVPAPVTGKYYVISGQCAQVISTTSTTLNNCAAGGPADDWNPSSGPWDTSGCAPCSIGVNFAIFGWTNLDLNGFAAPTAGQSVVMYYDNAFSTCGEVIETGPCDNAYTGAVMTSGPYNNTTCS